ncbi:MULTISPECIES: hypothetical protein [Bacillus cereus group]|uniref:hypothetical protein n=1 Tax=Bacillus cereus group TaxID=86661 RepID=UPI000B44305F|nr:hypothetical protein [Bacillus thuringiensis]ARZ63886.1 hypothetical protein B7P25_19620 [Bacillus thuringiensis]HDR4427798.1 hypothetical protein [Bacillus cereus]
MTASGRIFSEWKTTPDPANAELYAKVVEEQLNEANREKNIYLARIIELDAENRKLRDEMNQKPKDENEKLQQKSANK